MLTHSVETLYGYGSFSMPGPDVAIADHDENGVTVIDLPGPLVGERPAHDLRDRVLDLLEMGGRNFAVNLAEVAYADSQGVGALAAVFNLVRRQKGRIKFFAAPARLVRMLASLHLDTLFELFGDESSALASF